MAREVGSRDAASMQPLSPAGLPAEVAPLVLALNALLARLGARFDAQRAFVADAAHELRSPLTALRLQVGRLRRLGRGGDAAARESAVEALEGGVERAVRLVEQLLALARSEPAAPAAPFERVELGELARQAVADTVPYAASRGSELALDAEPGVVVDGDRAALAALVRNLADNAVRHSPPGARVQVQVAREDGAAMLHVDDSGPGIAQAERGGFSTASTVASRETAARPPKAQQGSGLGLAIVGSVAARHGAQVALGDSPLGGLRVRVRFGAAVRKRAGVAAGRRSRRPAMHRRGAMPGAPPPGTQAPSVPAPGGGPPAARLPAAPTPAGAAGLQCIPAISCVAAGLRSYPRDNGRYGTCSRSCIVLTFLGVPS